MKKWPAHVLAAVMAVTICAQSGLTAHAMSTSNEEIQGDILINGDTTHVEPYKVKAGDDLTLTGQLHIYDVRSQLEGQYSKELAAWLIYKNQQQYGWTGLSKWKTESDVQLWDNDINQVNYPGEERRTGVRCAFTVEIALPDGLTANDCEVTLDAGNSSLFNLAATVYDADKNVVTAEMTLKEPNSYADYPALKAAVKSIGKDETLNIQVAGIKVAENVELGTRYTISGEVSGRLYFNQQVDFPTVSYIDKELLWTGTQTDAGADAVDSDGIKLTVEVN